MISIQKKSVVILNLLKENKALCKELESPVKNRGMHIGKRNKEIILAELQVELVCVFEVHVFSGA